MDYTLIISKLKEALDSFSNQDSWLTAHDLSERSIAHRIACHLTPLFEGFHIDCEYNGDVERPNNRKAISALKDELQELGFLRDNEEIVEGSEIFRLVYPDIIIHSRGIHENNLCVIEIKKSSNNLPFEYDKLKLRCYTTDYHGNNLMYKLGVFIEVIVGTDFPTFNYLYFKNGRQINEPI